MAAKRQTPFLANACRVCRTTETPYPCPVCRMAFYCSPGHRRHDWYDHSRLCWAVNRICRLEDVDHLLQMYDGGDYAEFRHKVAKDCVEHLGRSLDAWELGMIYHPRVCNVCRNFNLEKLVPCKSCRFVYTCDKGHFRPDHGKWCDTLRRYWEIACSDGVTIDVDDFPRWETRVTESVTSMMDVLGDGKGKGRGRIDEEKVQVSELLTYPLTVLNCLRRIQVSGERVTVLFVGAEAQAEVEPVRKWEHYLLHQLPDSVRVLNLIFVGPELRTDSSSRPMDLCESCRSRRRELRTDFVPGKFYHEHTLGDGTRVDLICALNSGMYRQFGFAEKDSWHDTIMKMFTQTDAPILITEYTSRELRLDLDKLKILCGKLRFVVPHSLNPFAGLKPSLNVISEDESPVIFRNYYYALLKPKGKK